MVEWAGDKFVGATPISCPPASARPPPTTAKRRFGVRRTAIGQTVQPCHGRFKGWTGEVRVGLNPVAWPPLPQDDHHSTADQNLRAARLYFREHLGSWGCVGGRIAGRLCCQALRDGNVSRQFSTGILFAKVSAFGSATTTWPQTSILRTGRCESGWRSCA
jgi:hypothetical protein